MSSTDVVSLDGLEDTIPSKARKVIYTVHQLGAIVVGGAVAGLGYYSANGGHFSPAWTAVGVGFIAAWQGFGSLASTLAKSFLTTSGQTGTVEVADDESEGDGETEDDVDDSDADDVADTSAPADSATSEATAAAGA